MKIEYEATFPQIDKADVRKRLKKAKAKLIKKEFMQKRKVFHLPKGHEIKGGWGRVRDESDKITMSIKVVDGSRIEDQKEACITIDDFEEGCNLLKLLGCKEKAYQETKRELWTIDDVEVTIDEWPFLEPFVEIEGASEKAVKSVAKKLGFDYAKAKFCAVGKLYAEKYKISEDRINHQTPFIRFNDKNPFIGKKKIGEYAFSKK